MAGGRKEHTQVETDTNQHALRHIVSRRERKTRSLGHASVAATGFDTRPEGNVSIIYTAVFSRSNGNTKSSTTRTTPTTTTTGARRGGGSGENTRARRGLVSPEQKAALDV